MNKYMNIIKIIIFVVLAIQYYYIYIPLRIKKNFTRTYEAVDASGFS